MIWTLPLVSALIGWITNFIAVKMLFHPRVPLNLGILKVQGVFPKRKDKLAEKLGKIVGQELFNISDLKENMLHEENKEAIIKVIEVRIDSFLREKLKEAVPMIAMFISEDLINKIKTTLMNEFESSLPEILNTFAQKLEEKVDIEEIVKEKVNNFSMEKLEEIMFSIMKKEFKFIELVGGILGFIIGLVQIALIQFGGIH